MATARVPTAAAIAACTRDDARKAPRPRPQPAAPAPVARLSATPDDAKTRAAAAAFVRATAQRRGRPTPRTHRAVKPELHQQAPAPHGVRPPEAFTEAQLRDAEEAAYQEVLQQSRLEADEKAAIAEAIRRSLKPEQRLPQSAEYADLVELLQRSPDDPVLLARCATHPSNPANRYGP